MNINKTLLKNRNTSRGINTREYCVLHHTGITGEGNVRILSGEGSQVSVHYLVMLDGRVYQFVDENKIAWHCGVSKREGKTNLNNNCIGIEIESNGQTYTTIQRSKVRELVANIIKRNNMSVDKIITHQNIAGFRGKRDVSDAFRNNEYKTFKDYQNSFNSKKYKMTEKEKEMLIINQMNLNSTLYNMVEGEDSEELKKLMSEMNAIYRKKGFENK